MKPFLPSFMNVNIREASDYVTAQAGWVCRRERSGGTHEHGKKGVVTLAVSAFTPERKPQPKLVSE